MAKKKDAGKTEEDLFAQIAADTGGDVLSDREAITYFIDTGNLATNYVISGRFINGGFPGQKIIEMYGPSSSGKSLIAANALYGCQKLGGWPIILDCENATNSEFMERVSHLNLGRVLRYTPTTLEDAFLTIYDTVKKIRAVKDMDVPIVIIYDSISVSPCARELKETELPKDYKPSDWKKIVGRQEQPGERAKICSKELRKMGSMLEKFNVTLIVINQTREKIGVLYGNPETTGGGGNALPFYASIRLRTSTKKKIENKRLGTFAGVNMHIKNVKNRAFSPFRETEGVQLFFDTGINPISGILTALLQAERIQGKGGNYFVMPQYLPEGKTEYKFKASKERNDVPVQLLLDCPTLIDATTSEEVKEYLSTFGAAIAASASDDFLEKGLAFDADGNPLESDAETDELIEE